MVLRLDEQYGPLWLAVYALRWNMNWSLSVGAVERVRMARSAADEAVEEWKREQRAER